MIQLKENKALLRKNILETIYSVSERIKLHEQLLFRNYLLLEKHDKSA